MELVGSIGARLGAVVAVTLLAVAVLFRGGLSEVPWLPQWVGLALLIALGFLSFVGVVLSFRGLYTAWVKFANVLQNIVVTLLFGTCYLLIVPLFLPIVRVRDPLRLRRSCSDTGTYWISREGSKFDAESAERMG